jgi:hypothetical protein
MPLQLTRADSGWEGQGVSEAELAGRIAAHVERRACGRIRDLIVTCYGDLVVLRGRSRTYHAKQLAQEAVLDLLDGPSRLANRIVVH